MRNLSWTGVIFSALNLVVIVAIVSQGFEGSWGGFFIFVVNLPVSIPLLLIDYVVQPRFPWFTILAGALWWYVVGCWIEHWIRKKQSRNGSKVEPDEPL